MKIINSKIIDSFINSRQSSATIISLALNPEQAKYILKRLDKIGFSIPVKFNFGTKFKKNIHTKVIAEFSQIIYNILHKKNFPIRELPSIFPKESFPVITIPSDETGPPIFTISLLYFTVKPIESK